MDCCEIEGEDEDQSSEHAFSSTISINLVIVPDAVNSNQSLELQMFDDSKSAQFIERPPPEQVKKYIANLQLVLYA